MKQYEFFHRPVFSILLSALALGFWALKLDFIGIPLFLLFAVFLNWWISDTSIQIPIFLLAFLMQSKALLTTQLPIISIVIWILYFVSMFLHMKKFRQKWKPGTLSTALLIFLIAYALSMLINWTLTPLLIFYYFYGFFLAVFYAYLRSTMERDILYSFLKNMVIFGVFIALQIMIYYLRIGDILNTIENRTVDLGWGKNEMVAAFLIIFIPSSFLFSRQKNLNTMYFFIGVFELVMLFLSLSRGGILVGSFVFVIIFIYLFKSPYWKSTLFNFLMLLLVFAAVLVPNFEVFSAIALRFKELLLHDVNRIQIYEQGIQLFLAHPIFGDTFFTITDDYGDYMMFYNILIQTATSFGLLGIIALFLLIYRSYKTLIFQFCTETTTLAISFLGIFLLSLIENIFFLPVFMFVFLIILAILERSNESYKEFFYLSGDS